MPADPPKLARVGKEVDRINEEGTRHSNRSS
jgi:hypothetical protein